MEENMGNQTAIEQPESVEKLNDEIEVSATSIVENNELETEQELVSDIDEIKNVSTESPTIASDSTSVEDIQESVVVDVPENEAIETSLLSNTEASKIIEVENSNLAVTSDSASDNESEISIEKVKSNDNFEKEEGEETPSISKVAASESNTSNKTPILEEVSPVSDLLESETFEKLEEDLPHEKIDYTQLSKNELISLMDKAYLKINIEQPSSQDIKQADSLLNEIRPIFNGFKIEDKKAALQQFLSENESEDGFEYKETEDNQKFDNLFKKIKEAKHNHFKEIEKNKEKNFALKTELLNLLRTLADTESGELSTIKANILTLKKLQQEWKVAGNLAGPSQ